MISFPYKKISHLQRYEQADANVGIARQERLGTGRHARIESNNTNGLETPATCYGPDRSKIVSGLSLLASPI